MHRIAASWLQDLGVGKATHRKSEIGWLAEVLGVLRVGTAILKCPFVPVRLEVIHCFILFLQSLLFFGPAAPAEGLTCQDTHPGLGATGGAQGGEPGFRRSLPLGLAILWLPQCRTVESSGNSS